MNGSIQLGRMIVNNFYKINNWNELQANQKANQSTPWIKVHTKLLNDIHWNRLDDMAKALYIELQLLASENLGHLNDIDDISFRRTVNLKLVEKVLKLDGINLKKMIQLIFKSIALYATAMRCQCGANANLCDANG